MYKGTHRRKKVDEKSCVTFLLCDPGWYDHVPDWQPRILLGMVEARSVNVKKTTTTTSNELDVQNEWEGNTHTHHSNYNIIAFLVFRLIIII